MDMDLNMDMDTDTEIQRFSCRISVIIKFRRLFVAEFEEKELFYIGAIRLIEGELGP